MTILNKVKATDLVDQYWLPTSLRMQRPHISPTFALVLTQRPEVTIKLKGPPQATHDLPYWNFPYALIHAGCPVYPAWKRNGRIPHGRSWNAMPVYNDRILDGRTWHAKLTVIFVYNGESML